MVGSSKILTVSYGTFSCTLEGFEDSFSTMKAIAEYFRDLAADDRYFGAEPPTPDAEMLARIAEREVSRRVEARSDSRGIVLSALAPAAAPPAPAAEEPTPEPAAPAAADDLPPPAHAGAADQEEPSAGAAVGEDTSPLLAAAAPAEAPAPAAPAPAASAPGTTATAAPAMPPLADDDSVAAKLRRIRAVVGRNAAPAAPVAAEDGGEDAPMVGFASMDDEGSFPEADFSAPDSDVLDGDRARDVADDTADTAAAEDDIAAADAAAIEDPASEDRDADAGKDAGESLPEAVEAEAFENEAAFQDDAADAPDQPGMADPAGTEPEDDTAGLVDLSAYVAGTYDASEAEEGDLPVVGAAGEDTASEPAGEDDDEAAPATYADADADLADAAEEEVDDLLALDADDDEPVRARVIRMSRSDFEAAIARVRTPDTGDDEAENAFAEAAQDDEDDDGNAEEAFDDAAFDPDRLASEDYAAGTLSDEDEAELMSELAALEAGTDEDDAAGFWDEAVLTDDDLAGRDRAATETVDSSTVAAPNDHAGTDLAAADDDDDDDDDEIERTLAAALAEDRTGTDEPFGIEPAPDRESELPANALSAGDEAEAVHAETAAGAEDADRDDRAWLDSDDEDDGLASAGEAARHDEARVAPRHDDEDADADAPAAVDDAARSRLQREPEDDEDSISRLMSRAEGELSAPEARSRREAMTGLKAAVAAAEADRQLGDGKRHTDEAAFRDDLRQVVRPRRPEAGAEHRSERPRPAPLKLVASQRVDLPEPNADARPVQPVRPRRVTLDDVADSAPAAPAPKADTGFAQFASEMGAHDLPDLLEAAAAYTSFVEKAPDFSRPQLVNKVREMATGEFSREDELRSFGTLLRQGRIAKVRNGRFAVTEATRFHPERAAG
ncbi:hypothetical protein [Wenxinia marina]|uniref:Lipoprotein n=1 Tax=Wenxinia marina DSM 24838 TaxID=1123501 RepID=A0A0D0NIQ2_9RHOB|nr:hypothetical protein [Wenxinia marina]KIQ68185.1 hypothetical protein Wenmar_03195 [Wenxinia marina DSM 24838]GGL76619.1 hypothetical protein GCM10011392_33790 [Wenxinia marina]